MMDTLKRMELKLLRIEKGIKQKDIAETLNCSASLISQFEKNKRDMATELKEQYESIIRNRKI